MWQKTQEFVDWGCTGNHLTSLEAGRAQQNGLSQPSDQPHLSRGTCRPDRPHLWLVQLQGRKTSTEYPTPTPVTYSHSHTHTHKHPTIANFSRACLVCKDRAWMATVFCGSEKHCPHHPAHITHLRLTSEGKRRERGRLSPELPKVA